MAYARAQEREEGRERDERESESIKIESIFGGAVLELAYITIMQMCIFIKTDRHLALVPEDASLPTPYHCP